MVAAGQVGAAGHVDGVERLGAGGQAGLQLVAVAAQRVGELDDGRPPGGGADLGQVDGAGPPADPPGTYRGRPLASWGRRLAA